MSDDRIEWEDTTLGPPVPPRRPMRATPTADDETRTESWESAVRNDVDAADQLIGLSVHDLVPFNDLHASVLEPAERIALAHARYARAQAIALAEIAEKLTGPIPELLAGLANAVHDVASATIDCKPI